METEIHSFNNLGGKPRVPSSKDSLIGGVSAPQYTFKPVHPRTVQLPYYFQGKRPACGAHAGASYKVFLSRNDGTNTVEDDTPRALWINIKRDGTSPSEGTSMDRIFADLQTYNAVPFPLLGNDVTYDDADYAASKFLTPAMMQADPNAKISGYAYLTDQSFNGIKQAIDTFGAVLLLVRANAQMWTAPDGQTSWQEKDVLPLRPPTAQYPVVDGHFLLADHYDETYIYGPNSFSQQWGRQGDFYFGEDYASEIVEAGIAHNPPIPAPVDLPSPSAVETVQKAIPQVQSAISSLQSMPPEQKAQTENILQELLADLLKLL